MLEYAFFQEAPRKRLQEFLTAQGLAWTLEDRVMETLVVVDEAGLDDELAEHIEAMYDELCAAQPVAPGAPPPRPPAPADEGSDLGITLPDGRIVTAQVPRELHTRILSVITAQELAALAQLIGRAVLQADQP